MSTGSDQPRASIEMYLDGLLGEAQRTEFEAAVRADRRLRVEVEAQHRIDAALRRLFLPPALALNGRVTAAAETRDVARGPAASWRRWVYLVAAAALVLAGVGAGLWLLRPRPHPFAEAYQREVLAGFVPAEKCTDEAQFVAWTKRAVGMGIRTVSLPAGTEVLGWNYRRIDGIPAGVLLARVDGREVEVFMVRNLALEDAPPERSRGPVRVFRRQLERVFLFEATPLERPVLLNSLEAAPEAAKRPGAGG